MLLAQKIFMFWEIFLLSLCIYKFSVVHFSLVDIYPLRTLFFIEASSHRKHILFLNFLLWTKELNNNKKDSRIMLQ